MTSPNFSDTLRGRLMDAEKRIDVLEAQVRGYQTITTKAKDRIAELEAQADVDDSLHVSSLKVIAELDENAAALAEGYDTRGARIAELEALLRVARRWMDLPGGEASWRIGDCQSVTPQERLANMRVHEEVGPTETEYAWLLDVAEAALALDVATATSDFGDALITLHELLYGR